MTTTDLSLEEIYNLALKTLKYNGCDDLNAKRLRILSQMRKETEVYLTDFLESQDILLL